MSVLSSLRSVAPYFLIASFVVAIALFGLRCTGLLTEEVTVAFPATDPSGTPVERDLEIVTLLPKDAIPAIFDPEIISAKDANQQLSDTDLVIGVSIEGQHRAYGVAFLSGHEIVDDTLGGRAIAATW